VFQVLFMDAWAAVHVLTSLAFLGLMSYPQANAAAKVTVNRLLDRIHFTGKQSFVHLDPSVAHCSPYELISVNDNRIHLNI
jgi:hypothetical protein